MIAIVGLMLCAVFYLKYPHFFKFKLIKSFKFMVLHILLALLVAQGARMAGLTKVGELENVLATNSKPEEAQIEALVLLYDMPMYKAALAGFEDAIFVLPLLPIQNPIFLGVGITTSTVLFTAGHRYQGTASMLGKLHYVGLAYYFASRYGILTTMIAHAVNDVIAVWSLKKTLKKLCGDVPIRQCLEPLDE